MNYNVYILLKKNVFNIMTNGVCTYIFFTFYTSSVGFWWNTKNVSINGLIKILQCNGKNVWQC